MPNWFPEGTGEEGDEHGEQHRQYQDREHRREMERREREERMPRRCQSVFGCSNKPFGETDGVWLCLSCFALNDKFG